MRILPVLSLVVLLSGCGAAAARRTATPEVPWNEFSADGLTISAPPGWEEALQVVEPQPNRPYSVVSLVNAQRQSIVVIHPHGNFEYAERVFLSNLMRSVLMAAALAQQPELREELQIQSLTLTDPVDLAGIEGAYWYMITTVKHNGTVEENRILMMMLQPPDASTTILVSTTVPAADGEQFPAEVLAVARTARYAAPQ